jgi:hypothetical protein
MRIRQDLHTGIAHVIGVRKKRAATAVRGVALITSRGRTLTGSEEQRTSRKDTHGRHPKNQCADCIRVNECRGAHPRGGPCEAASDGESGVGGGGGKWP